MALKPVQPGAALLSSFLKYLLRISVCYRKRFLYMRVRDTNDHSAILLICLNPLSSSITLHVDLYEAEVIQLFP